MAKWNMSLENKEWIWAAPHCYHSQWLNWKSQLWGFRSPGSQKGNSSISGHTHSLYLKLQINAKKQEGKAETLSDWNNWPWSSRDELAITQWGQGTMYLALRPFMSIFSFSYPILKINDKNSHDLRRTWWLCRPHQETHLDQQKYKSEGVS